MQNSSTRVLLISQYFAPDKGGASTRSKIMIKSLNRKDYEIDLIVGVPHYPDGNKNSRVDRKFFKRQLFEKGIITRFWMPSISHNSGFGRIVNYIFFSFAACIGILIARKPDVIFAQSPNFFSWFPALFGKMIRRIPIIVNIDDLWPEALNDFGILNSKYLTSFIKIIRELVFLISDRVVCISSTIAQYAVQAGASPKKVRTIEVGFDISNLCINKSYNPNFKLNEFRIVYSGILGPAYDFDSILELAQICSKKQNQIKFYLKGRGPETHKIQTEVHRKKLMNIEIINRWFSLNEHFKFLQSADVFILPMKNNFISTTALPTKLFEYMGVGKPVVVIGLGEVFRLIEKAKCGIAVSHNNLDTAAEYILDLYNHPSKILILGNSGKRYIENYLSVPAIGQKFHELFNEIIHR